MEVEDLLDRMRFVELVATTRSEAIEELVRAGNWEDQGLATVDVIEAIEAREAAAQTVIAKDIALPHAAIAWDGSFLIVLGRSRTGVQYGAAGDIVHLIALLVVGKKRHRTHLQILARVAELLESEELRQSLTAARDPAEIEWLLHERARRKSVSHIPARRELPPLNVILVSQAAQLAVALDAQALLLAVDRCNSVPWESLADWTRRLLLVTTDSADKLQVERADTHLYAIPHQSLSRMDRANLGLLLAAADGLVTGRTNVVCVTGPPGPQLDNVTVTEPKAHFRAMFSGRQEKGSSDISPAVLLRILCLAVELASEGREGQPIGAMFVIGDTRNVMRHAQQLILNPFYGIPRRLRNVLDPSLAETIKEFALLDGAFIIQDDGTALAVGTYLAPDTRVTDLPGGLGTRHQVAAGITADTRAMAITVSQSTGTLTVFHNGGIVLTLERAAMTRW